MAKLIIGLLGGISGKVGPIVGATWKGVEYVRAAAAPSTKPRTEKQIAQQVKFKFLQNFLKPFQKFIVVGFRNDAIRRTECNVAFSLNYKSAIIGSYPDFSIDYSKVIMSKGILPNLFEPKIKFLTAGTLELSWSVFAECIGSFEDQVTLLLYNPRLQKIDGFIGGVSRSAARCTFDINPRLIGESLEVYVSLTSNNRKLISNSLYMGRLSR